MYFLNGVYNGFILKYQYIKLTENNTLQIFKSMVKNFRCLCKNIWVRYFHNCSDNVYSKIVEHQCCKEVLSEKRKGIFCKQWFKQIVF